MDIIDMPLIIQIIADQVFPIATLPNPTFASFDATFRAPFTQWN